MAAKPPKSWMLTEDESFSSFINWRRTIIGNLQHDNYNLPFLKQGVTWEKKHLPTPKASLTMVEQMA